MLEDISRLTGKPVPDSLVKERGVAIDSVHRPARRQACFAGRSH
jgi:hypothetical protein